MPMTAVLLTLSVLTAAGASLAAPAAADAPPPQYRADARIWVENDREYFRHGDRLRVNFSTSANSYVAVVHVDPEGYLEFVYPSSPWDDEFVRGGRIHSVDGSGFRNGLLVRGGSGIGYLYVIASPVPLDYSRFRSGAGSSWDWSYAGRRVSGDPFWAMEQLTRMLVPGWGNAPHVADYYTYFVGGPQRYPSYACSGYTGATGWGYSPAWSSYYDSCGRLDYFLRDNPYYFDSRRYRGDRYRYYRDYRDARDWDPRHVYKVNPERPAARPAVRLDTPAAAAGRTDAAPRERAVERPAARPAQRVAPERSPSSPAPERAAPRPAARPAPAPAERTREREPQRSQPTQRTRPESSSAGSSGRAGPAPTRASPTARPSGSSDGGSSSTPRSRRGG